MRPASSDFLHNMRFHVTVANSEQVDPLVPGTRSGPEEPAGTQARPQAGFTACSIPDISIEAVEYKEGTYIYPMKFPGNPTVGDCTLSRGVVRLDTAMWDWALSCVEGSEAAVGANYRGDVTINHYHRSDYLPSVGTTVVDVDSLVGAKQYQLWNCFPSSCKPSSDLDATSSDIAVAEMTITVERMTVRGNAAA